MGWSPQCWQGGGKGNTWGSIKANWGEEPPGASCAIYTFLCFPVGISLGMFGRVREMGVREMMGVEDVPCTVACTLKHTAVHQWDWLV